MVFNNNGCNTLRQLLSLRIANNEFLNGMYLMSLCIDNHC